MKKKAKFRIRTINIRKRKRWITFLFVVASIVMVAILYLRFVVNPIIFDTTNYRITVFANRSMNIAVTTAMNQGIAYSDLIKIEMNDGKTTLLQANSVKINALAKLITRTIHQNLVELLEDPIDIHIGAFSGIPALGGIGPAVKIKINPYGDISCRFKSEFVSAGINQTHHKIYLNLTTDVNVVFPSKTLKVKTKSEVLICESVIIGEIPSTYLMSDSLDEMMNLIPI